MNASKQMEAWARICSEGCNAILDGAPVKITMGFYPTSQFYIEDEGNKNRRVLSPSDRSRLQDAIVGGAIIF